MRGPFVRAARRAELLREAADRLRAALLAWRASALREAAFRGSLFSARRAPRARVADGRVRRRAARFAYRALRFVDAFARRGGGNLTPARRAFDKPIAIACLVDRAPCLPSRM
jgi:hypothetical protein